MRKAHIGVDLALEGADTTIQRVYFKSGNEDCFIDINFPHTQSGKQKALRDLRSAIRDIERYDLSTATY